MDGDQKKKLVDLTKKDARVVQSMEESGVTNQSVGGDVEQSSWRQASSNYSSTTQCLFVKKDYSTND